jgi:hypothetical protein
MKQQAVITYTIRQTEIPALLHNWVTNTPSVKTLCARKIACRYSFVQT